MKVDVNNRRKTGKFTNMWKLKSTFLDNQFKEETTGEIRRYFEKAEVIADCRKGEHHLKRALVESQRRNGKIGIY